MGDTAVAFRLHELQASILTADEEISNLDRKIDAQIKTNASLDNQRDDEHQTLMDKINSNHSDELAADVVLTDHYKDTAAEACISALMKQQDAVLLREKAALKDLVLKYADSHLQSKEKELLTAHADEKVAALTVEEAQYMHHVQLAIIQHKERMGQVQGLQEDISP